MSTDVKKAGTSLPVSRVLLQSVQGRALAALGRNAEAGIALEAAATEACRFGLRLYEAFALRDLKLILDQIGHGDHGSRRLGAVLRLMKGPADSLTPLLKGLQADELMAMAPPDAARTVVYEHNTSDQGLSASPAEERKLRAELSGMKLKALKVRARKLGVHEQALEDADDADDIVSAVTVLCIAAAAAGDEGGGALAGAAMDSEENMNRDMTLS
jgi:hypothetical protein